MTEIVTEVHDVHIVGELVDVQVEDGTPVVVVIEELVTVQAVDDDVVEVNIGDLSTAVVVQEDVATVQQDATIVVEINPVGLPGPQGPSIPITVATVPPTPQDTAAENALWFVIA